MARKSPRTTAKSRGLTLFDPSESRIAISDMHYLVSVTARRLAKDNRRGDADAPVTKNKKIRIRITGDPFMDMDTLTHEYYHLSMWHLAEEAVLHQSLAHTQLQWDYGIRPLDQDMLAMWEEKYGNKQ